MESPKNNKHTNILGVYDLRWYMTIKRHVKIQQQTNSLPLKTGTRVTTSSNWWKIFRWPLFWILFWKHMGAPSRYGIPLDLLTQCNKNMWCMLQWDKRINHVSHQGVSSHQWDKLLLHSNGSCPYTIYERITTNT